MQGNGDAVNELVVWLVLLDAWIAPVATFHTERKTWDGHLQKLYADTYQGIVKFSMKLLTGNVAMFV